MGRRKKLKQIFKIFALTLAIGLPLTLCGCTNIKESKSELKATIDEMQIQIDNMTNENNKVRRLMEEFNGGLKKYASENYYADGSIESYNSIKGTVILPSKLSLVGTTSASNTSRINLNDFYTIAPSGSKWFANINGTETNFIHNDGISGYTKVLTLEKNTIYEDTYTQYIEKYLTNIGSKTIKKHEIFIDKNKAGVYLDGEIKVNIDNDNTKTYIIRSGIVGVGESGIQFQFMFEKGSAGDELVMNLLSTIKYGSQQIRIE